MTFLNLPNPAPARPGGQPARAGHHEFATAKDAVVPQFNRDRTVASTEQVGTDDLD
jgi:hypothetical protein